MSVSLFNDQYQELSVEEIRSFDTSSEQLSRPFKFPTLYTYTKSTDKYRVYNIGFDGYNIVSETGILGGKIRVTTSPIVLRGSNNNYQQGFIDVRSRWNKKIKERYVTNMEEGRTMMNRQPMLANKFDSTKLKTYPVWSQIKYDGMRFLAGLSDEQVVIRSRLGNEFNHLSHLRYNLLPILQDLSERYPDSDILIDGELIVPDATFQDTCSIIKSATEVHPRNGEVVALVFDLMIPEPYQERWDILSEYIDTEPDHGDPLKLINSSIHNSLESIQYEFNRVIEQGHEGLMIRDPTSLYVNGRTNSLMKLKSIETDEGVIIDVVEGTGTHRGLAIFILRDSLNVETHVVPAASQDQRREWFHNREELIGRRYQYMFNERMSGTNAPRNPVGVRFMD